jgi:hypothetical protein
MDTCTIRVKYKIQMATTILLSHLFPERVGSRGRRISKYTSNKYHFQCANLFIGDRSQFAWDSNFALHRRNNLLSRHGETRSEPVTDLIRDNFNDSHARVILIALVDSVA